MDSTYKQETMKYGKKDAIIALCVYVVFMIWASLFFAISQDYVGDVRWMQVVGMAGAVALTAIVFVVTTVRKQGLPSIGIHKERLLPAICLGLMFAVIPLIINVAVPAALYEGLELRPIGSSLYLLFYFSIMAAYEDIFFVGFLQTRLYGLVKTDRAAISLGAVLFSFIHIPVALMSMELLGFELVFYLVGLLFMHQALVLIFRRHFSIFAVIVVHTIINWSYTSIWLWGGAETNYAFFWASITGLAFVIAVNIWDWRIRRRG